MSDHHYKKITRNYIEGILPESYIISETTFNKMVERAQQRMILDVFTPDDYDRMLKDFDQDKTLAESEEKLFEEYPHTSKEIIDNYICITCS